MTASRRDFVKTTAAAGAALALGGHTAGAQNETLRLDEDRNGKADAPLKILILGGTGFTGPHQVNYAVARGHTVAVFNRGRRQADIPNSVEHLRGDRNAPDGVAALKRSRTWDVVIDIPTTMPKWVRDAGLALKGRTNQYIFISTISTYAGFPSAGMDETSELAKYSSTTDPFALPADSAGRYYGPLKVLSEQEAEKHFPGKTTIIRPGLIVGPGDPSDRFTYWPVRIARGGEVLAPGDRKDPVQIIDARDLAEWVIRMAEQNATGIYNATGPRSPLDMGEMLGGIRAAMPGDLDVKFSWASAEFLQQQQVRGWSDLPVWVAPRENNAGWSRVSIDRALAKGLTFRPLAVTAKDTLEWDKTRPEQERTNRRAGLKAEREAEVLAAWKARSA
ncbi:MAG: NAD-dependent epimerase/dehydratase family protein [Pseudomonas sp.]